MSLRLINVVGVILALLLFYLLVVVIGPTVYNRNVGGIDSLPVSIRAGSAADYSHDAHAIAIPPISENIINQIIVDMPATGSPQERAAVLQDVLSSPVPTMTPDLHLQATSTPTLPLPEPTSSVGKPGATGSPTFIPTATAVFTLLPAPTQVDSPTSTVVNVIPTSIPPAATVGITPIPTTPIPTTPIPVVITPTNQPAPTNTPLPPTNTPLPPAATATPKPAATEKPTNVPKPTNTHRPTSKP